MIELISTKVVKTRKPHNCFACCRKFDSGTMMKRNVNVHDGEIYSLYECETCKELLRKYPSDIYDDCEAFIPVDCVHDTLHECSEYHGLTPETLLNVLDERERNKLTVGVITPDVYLFLAWERAFGKPTEKYIHINKINKIRGIVFDRIEFGQRHYEVKIPEYIIESRIKQVKK